MVEVNTRNNRDDGRQNVRGIEPTAKPNLEDAKFDAFARKPFERHGGYAFEVRGMCAQPMLGQKLLDDLSQPCEDCREGMVADLFAVNSEPLIDSFEMRRCVQPVSKARVAKNGFQKGRG